MLSVPTMNGIHGHRYLENESFRNEGDEIRYLVLKYPKRFWFIPKRPEVWKSGSYYYTPRLLSNWLT